jgi:hypothetical protein
MRHPITASIHLPILAAGILAAAALSTSATALEAAPGQITFNSIQESERIALSHNGAPVPASDVQSVKLYVANHDYDHMIEVSREDGAITVRPTGMLELGTYDLAIRTAHGETRVPVFALLQIVDDSLEARAARLGVTVEEVKARLGISQAVGQDRVSLNIPDLYYVGQALESKVPLQAGRDAVWTINGTAYTAEDGVFRYVFEQPGTYDIGYVESANGMTVAVGLDTTLVVPEPAVKTSVAAGTKLTLHAPPGYQDVAWTLDGEPAGFSAHWSGDFSAPGEHAVTARASSPAPGAQQAFLLVTYKITVTPAQ